eukprot:357594-Chlamydomonas_euryale.AAC.1
MGCANRALNLRRRRPVAPPRRRPAGWWHAVLNLLPSVAVTQNFVSAANLPRVLRHMAHGWRHYHRNVRDYYSPTLLRQWGCRWRLTGGHTHGGKASNAMKGSSSKGSSSEGDSSESESGNSSSSSSSSGGKGSGSSSRKCGTSSDGDSGKKCGASKRHSNGRECDVHRFSGSGNARGARGGGTCCEAGASHGDGSGGDVTSGEHGGSGGDGASGEGVSKGRMSLRPRASASRGKCVLPGAQQAVHGGGAPQGKCVLAGTQRTAEAAALAAAEAPPRAKRRCMAQASPPHGTNAPAKPFPGIHELLHSFGVRWLHVRVCVPSDGASHARVCRRSSALLPLLRTPMPPLMPPPSSPLPRDCRRRARASLAVRRWQRDRILGAFLRRLWAAAPQLRPVIAESVDGFLGGCALRRVVRAVWQRVQVARGGTQGGDAFRSCGAAAEGARCGGGQISSGGSGRSDTASEGVRCGGVLGGCGRDGRSGCGRSGAPAEGGNLSCDDGDGGGAAAVVSRGLLGSEAGGWGLESLPLAGADSLVFLHRGLCIKIFTGAVRPGRDECGEWVRGPWRDECGEW